MDALSLKYAEKRFDTIFKAIEKNGLSAFTDEALTQVLSALTIPELAMFLQDVVVKVPLDDYRRLKQLVHDVKLHIEADMYRIEKSSTFKNFLTALVAEGENPGTCLSFLSHLDSKALADLKRYYTNKEEKPETEAAVQKVIEMINYTMRQQNQGNKHLR
ncbi:MAG: hypothetical protein J1F35_04285 [Erysipelotrichales bacterium]|nr:hypothetical protein [Erysipelotrichales bacterium]